jgi:Bacterial PH domain
MAKLEKLLDQAQEHLDEGEEVLATVKGTYETKKMGNDWTRAGILVATDHRVVFYAKKVGGYDLEVFP